MANIKRKIEEMNILKSSEIKDLGNSAKNKNDYV